MACDSNNPFTRKIIPADKQIMYDGLNDNHNSIGNLEISFPIKSFCRAITNHGYV